MRKMGAILLVLILMCMCACTKKATTGAEEEVSGWSFMDQGVSIGKDGVLYEQDKLLQFGDYNSHNRVVFCNKPNCKHLPYDKTANSDPYCDAALPFESASIFDSFICGGRVYTMIADMKNTTIYQRKLGDSGWNEWMKVPYCIQPGLYEVVNGVVYRFAVKIRVDSETSQVLQIPYMVKIDLNQKKYQVLSGKRKHGDGEYRDWQVIGNKVYYVYSYLSEKAQKKELADLEESDYEAELYCYDLDKNRESLVLESSFLTKYHYFGVYQNAYQNAIYVYYEDQIYEYNLVEKRTRLVDRVSKGSIFGGYVFGDNIIIGSNNGDNDYKYSFHLTNHKIRSILRPEGESMPILEASGKLLLMSCDNGAIQYNSIRMDDYIEGKTDFLLE